MTLVAACTGNDNSVMNEAQRACRPLAITMGDACGIGPEIVARLWLDQAIHSMIEVKEEKDIDSLFSGGKTTALVDTIAGLDDFELITFIVIQNVA